MTSISKADIEAALAKMDYNPNPPIYYVSKPQYDRIKALMDRGISVYNAIHYGYCGYTYDEIPERYKP